MDLVRFVIGSFATYRLAYAISQEEGPFSLFQELRNLFVGNNWISRGIRCIYCVSFWVGLAIALAMRLKMDWLVNFLALSGGAIVLDKYWKR